MTHDILVIGTSAGGYTTLPMLLSQLPSDFPAAVFIVQHISPNSAGVPLVNGLQKKVSLTCKLAKNGEQFSKGTVYFAPPDHHMLIKEKKYCLPKDPRKIDQDQPLTLCSAQQQPIMILVLQG